MKRDILKRAEENFTKKKKNVSLSFIDISKKDLTSGFSF